MKQSVFDIVFLGYLFNFFLIFAAKTFKIRKVGRYLVINLGFIL